MHMLIYMYYTSLSRRACKSVDLPTRLGPKRPARHRMFIRDPSGEKKKTAVDAVMDP